MEDDTKYTLKTINSRKSSNNLLVDILSHRPVNSSDRPELSVLARHICSSQPGTLVDKNTTSLTQNGCYLLTDWFRCFFTFVYKLLFTFRVRNFWTFFLLDTFAVEEPRFTWSWCISRGWHDISIKHQPPAKLRGNKSSLRPESM